MQDTLPALPSPAKLAREEKRRPQSSSKNIYHETRFLQASPGILDGFAIKTEKQDPGSTKFSTFYWSWSRLYLFQEVSTGSVMSGGGEGLLINPSRASRDNLLIFLFLKEKLPQAQINILKAQKDFLSYLPSYFMWIWQSLDQCYF